MRTRTIVQSEVHYHVGQSQSEVRHFQLLCASEFAGRVRHDLF